MKKEEIYNQGVKSGLKVATNLIEREKRAMDYLENNIRILADHQLNIRDTVHSIIEDADENAIKDLFNICTPATPLDLKPHEKMMLMSIVASLSSSNSNENQKKFLNNLRHILNINGYVPDLSYDYRCIEQVESVKSIKIMAKTIRAYLFLNNCDFETCYVLEDSLFQYFELRSFEQIDAEIDLLYCLFGEDGIVEMFGVCYEDETDSKEEESIYNNYQLTSVLDMTALGYNFASSFRTVKELGYIKPESILQYQDDLISRKITPEPFFSETDGQVYLLTKKLFDSKFGTDEYFYNMAYLYGFINRTRRQILWGKDRYLVSKDAKKYYKKEFKERERIKESYDTGKIITEKGNSQNRNVLKEIAWLITHNGFIAYYIKVDDISKLIPMTKNPERIKLWNDYVSQIWDIPEYVKKLYYIDDNGDSKFSIIDFD